jgi:hypothetical protein
MNVTNHRWITPVVALTLLAVGCSDPSGSETAQVSLALTDNPGDVDSVWVEIGEIYLQGGGAQGRVTLLSEADAEGLGMIELTQLAGTTLDLVSDVTIDAGNYGQLRFVVESAVLETEDGDVFTFNATHPHGLPATGSLTCPSCSTTGIKVLLPGDVANLDGGSHLIVLDFDVSQSFGHPTGQTTGWVMHPVIRGAELAFSGGVHGTVDVARDVNNNPLVTIPNCPAGTARDITSFIPEAVAQTLTDDLGDPLRATSTVASDSTFSFAYLHPDQYVLGFIANVDFGGDTLTFAATAPGLVNVTSGADLDVTYTITSAVCS